MLRTPYPMVMADTERITYDFRVHGFCGWCEAAAPTASAPCGSCGSSSSLLLPGAASAGCWCRRRRCFSFGVVCSCCGCWASLFRFSEASPQTRARVTHPRSWSSFYEGVCLCRESGAGQLVKKGTPTLHVAWWSARSPPPSCAPET